MMRFILLAGLFAGLAGCMTAQERAQRQAAADESQCANFGFQFGTPEFAQCRMNLATQREANDAALVGAMLASRPPPYRPPPPPPQTTCIMNGNVMTCR